MAQKIVELPGIGKVTLAKRRGARNIRLSIQPNGNVRVSLPTWAPYSTAISFALTRSEWINKNRQNYQPMVLKNGHRIGKSYRLNFVAAVGSKHTYARLGINSITITSHLDPFHDLVQKSAAKASEKALKKEAESLLGLRLQELATKNSLSYSGFRSKRLTSRWGSCSNDGVITLNYFLIQLPWPLIDYVIVHELAHTRHLNHSPEFWGLVERILPNAKSLRKEIKRYQPVLLPN